MKVAQQYSLLVKFKSPKFRLLAEDMWLSLVCHEYYFKRIISKSIIIYIRTGNGVSLTCNTHVLSPLKIFTSENLKIICCRKTVPGPNISKFRVLYFLMFTVSILDITKPRFLPHLKEYDFEKWVVLSQLSVWFRTSFQIERALTVVQDTVLLQTDRTWQWAVRKE